MENKFEQLQGEKGRSSIVEDAAIKKFIEFRAVQPEDFHLIEGLAAFPKNLIIAELHNLFNMSKENSAREIERLIENSQDEDKRAMLRMALEFNNKYDWMTSLNLVRILEVV